MFSKQSEMAHKSDHLIRSRIGPFPNSTVNSILSFPHLWGEFFHICTESFLHSISHSFPWHLSFSSVTHTVPKCNSLLSFLSTVFHTHTLSQQKRPFQLKTDSPSSNTFAEFATSLKKFEMSALNAVLAGCRRMRSAVLWVVSPAVYLSQAKLVSGFST